MEKVKMMCLWAALLLAEAGFSQLPLRHLSLKNDKVASRSKMIEKVRKNRQLYKHQLRSRQRLWMEGILRTAMQSEDMAHMYELLLFEKRQLAAMATMKAASLTTVEEWQKHAFSLMVAGSVLGSLDWDTVATAGRNAAWYAVWEQEVSEMKYARASQLEFLEAPRDLEMDLDMDLAGDVVSEIMWEAPRHAAGAALAAASVNAVGDEVWYMMRRAAQEANSHDVVAELQGVAHDVLKDLCSKDAQVVGRTAYRLMAVLSWLELLDPQAGLLEQVYDLAYAQLSKSNKRIDCAGWFDSQESLELKIAQYFGKLSDLSQQDGAPLPSEVYSHRYRYIEFYVWELRRIYRQVQLLKGRQQGSEADSEREHSELTFISHHRQS
ncbi:MAG: hypothetical protein OXT67_08005 [Zetaproteobacteria bacterium]|nr:hypothetical protein [Zetaproteobacteria bacterium]